MAETLRAMISSTTLDLKVHREAARDACLRLKVLPLMMENEPPADRDATALSLALADEADVYVLILGFRYGVRPPDGGKSYTHRELDRAQARGLPIIVLLMGERHPMVIGDVEFGPGGDAVRALRAELEQTRVVQYFSSAEEMRGKLISDLATLLDRRRATAPPAAARQTVREPGGPVPPAPFHAHPYTLVPAREVVGRHREIAALDRWLTDPASELHQHRVLVVTAIGGMGKSALAWKFFHDVAPAAPGLVGRLWWSFYDQDSGFDTFVLRALAYVTGDTLTSLRTVPAAERVDQLLEVLGAQPFLVVLDGVERLLLAYSRSDAARVRDGEVEEAAAQAADQVRGIRAGTRSFAGNDRLRTATDPRVGAFLRRLPDLAASRVLVTSRLFPRELQRRDGRAVAGSALFPLDGLDEADALALWRDPGCRGTEAELAALLRSFGNYPLLIRALSAEVATFRPGPGDYTLWRRAHPAFDPFRVDLLTDDDRKSHVLAFALQGLTDVDRQVLQTIAAFSAPVAFDRLRDLVAGPHRPVRDDAELDRVLAGLEDRGLLGWDRGSNRYDLHPVVRGVAIAGLDPQAERAIYERLAEHFGSAPEIDDEAVRSLDDLADPIELFHTYLRLRDSERLGDLLAELVMPLVRIGAFDTLLALAEATQRDRVAVEGAFVTDDVPTEQALGLLIGIASLLAGDPARAVESLEVPPSWPDSARTSIGALRSLAEGELGRLYVAEQEVLARSDVVLNDPGLVSTLAIPLGRVLLRTGRRTDGLRWLADHRNVLSALAGIPLIDSGWDAVVRGDFPAAHAAAVRLDLLADERRDPRAGLMSLALSGAAARCAGDLGRARPLLDAALARARDARFRDDEITIRVELARWHLASDAPAEARAQALEAGELGARYQLRLREAEALAALAAAEFALGDIAASAVAADQAYRAAWCDGGPSSYAVGLTSARAQLTAVGAPVPTDLPALTVSPLPVPALEPVSTAAALRRCTATGDAKGFGSIAQHVWWAPPDPDLVPALSDALQHGRSNAIRRAAAVALELMRSSVGGVG